uniref:Uncharacterized protein n=1 Tax=Globodera rostochiensis TaxID=31243 RepID=A0A914HR13_GLORO
MLRDNVRQSTMEETSRLQATTYAQLILFVQDNAHSALEYWGRVAGIFGNRRNQTSDANAIFIVFGIKKCANILADAPLDAQTFTETSKRRGRAFVNADIF